MMARREKETCSQSRNDRRKAEHYPPAPAGVRH